jgi:hypothetical protein
MTLKEWLKKIDLVIDVKIWGQDDEIPLFEGSAFDIPWTIIDFQLGRMDDLTAPPIYICTYKNERNVTLPIIVINVIEKEEDFPF